MKKFAVIGAGLSGVSCARKLQDRGEVHIFDKSRGVSGRMSTRYTDNFEFDHGAQYFTARSPDFRRDVLAAIEDGHVAPWQGRAFYLKDTGMEPDIGGDRFTAVPRMNSWTKTLAANLDVRLGARVVDINRTQGLWSLTTESGHVETGYDAVVLAVPAPQAEALLPPEFSGISDVKRTEMEACFALMLGFNDLPDLGWDSLRVQSGSIAWIAVNSSKPGRALAPTLMVHGAAAWSNQHVDDDREALAARLLSDASHIAGVNLDGAVYKTLHRWLYASSISGPDKPCLYDKDLSLAVCGDWCLGGRVENAYLSGRAAARQIIAAL
jgi:predicted NAD/FAD-dependent oxidoreductase